jgi:two-component system, OmpR family, sensor histidine kinase CpxA
MAHRFPIYARILFWLFLNLVALASAFYLLVRAQFGFGLDWLLTGSAGERVDAVSNVIFTELNDRPRSEWNTVLKRFSAAYRIQFLVFHADGHQLAGEATRLPEEVRAKLVERPVVPEQGARSLGNGPPPPRGPLPPVPPPRLAQDDTLTPPAERHSVNPKFMFRTTGPTRYWLLVRSKLSDSPRPRLIPVALIAGSNSLGGGGLIFDSKPWVAVGLGALVFSVLLWLPLVQGITRSIAQMTRASQQIAEGRFDVRVDDRRHDELGTLGQALNRMASRLGALVTGQKRFLGDVAHELCSPLARLQMVLGILEQRADEQQKTYVNAACEKAGQIAGLVNELLSFSKASLGASVTRLRPVPLRDLADKAVQREKTGDTPIRVEIADGLRAMGEPDLLLRAVSNLVRNALRYAGHAGPITVSARRDNGHVLLVVGDCGPGVPEPDLTQIFDPFYRVEASRDRATGGVGLGLAIVKTCVESCGGSVMARNRAPSGLEVVIKLPVAPAA